MEGLTLRRRALVFRGCLSSVLLISCAEIHSARDPSRVDRDRAQMFYKDARGYVATYEYSAGLGNIRQAETFDPSSMEIRAYRERLARVMDAFSDRLGRENLGHIFLEGISKYVAAEYGTALLCLGSALGSWPLDERLQRFIKQVEKETGYKLDPNDIRPPQELAALKLESAGQEFNEGRLTQALILCRQVIVLEPDNALAYTRMGSVHFALGDYDHAREAWTQALALKPDDKELKQFLDRMELRKKPTP